MTKEKLKAYLIEEADYTEDCVDAMDAYDMLNAWLEWNGIIGWTSDIMDVVEAAFDVNLDF